MDDNPMAQLRQWRKLSARRNANVRLAAREGKSQEQIARAAGLSPSRVRQILERWNCS